jgi:O-acetyl-ADP-ribose deacetylase (regulator of RNase III)
MRKHVRGTTVIERRQGSVLDADAEAIVNTVNCVGVIGKGVALLVKRAYPQVYARYREACEAGEVRPGRVLAVPTGRPGNPKYIINFPTKRHWRQPSRLDDIRAGLPALIEKVKELGLRSVAVPALGCGNGGLDWDTVRPLIEEAFATLPDVHVLLFDPMNGPAGAPAAQPLEDRRRCIGENRAQNLPAASDRHRRPTDAGIAALLHVMARYQELGDELAPWEVARLAYLLQAAGMPLPFQGAAAAHEPSPEGLAAMLPALAPFLRGRLNLRQPHAPVTLQPAAVTAAEQALAGLPETMALAERVARLIEGFETPYGLELLVTVHHLARDLPDAATDAERAVTEAIARFGHERRYLQPNHVRKAWQRLHEQGWLPRAALAVPAR